MVLPDLIEKQQQNILRGVICSPYMIIHHRVKSDLTSSSL